GKAGPTYQEFRCSIPSGSGGIQSGVTFSVIRFPDALKRLSFVSLAKWISGEITPSIELREISTHCNSESSPKLVGIVPLIWFLSRVTYVKDFSSPNDIGRGPEMELASRESRLNLVNFLISSLN
ncbi:unnamed protein product, partial [Linum tenue]